MSNFNVTKLLYYPFSPLCTSKVISRHCLHRVYAYLQYHKSRGRIILFIYE